MILVLGLVLALQVFNLVIGVLCLIKCYHKPVLKDIRDSAKEKNEIKESNKNLKGQQQKLYALLENIDRYDGTAKGQVKI